MRRGGSTRLSPVWRRASRECARKRADLSEQSHNLDEHFPYRTATRVEVNNALAGVQDLVANLANEMNRWGFTDDELDDLIAQCMSELWRRGLPAFDTRKNTKLSTFLHGCAFKFFQMQMPRDYRRLRRQPTPLPNESFGTCVAPDVLMDNRIIAVAQRILRNPDEYVSEAQANVLRVMTNHPGLTKKQMAVMLGYTRSCTLSKILRRLRKVLADFDIESL